MLELSKKNPPKSQKWLSTFLLSFAVKARIIFRSFSAKMSYLTAVVNSHIMKWPTDICHLLRLGVMWLRRQLLTLIVMFSNAYIPAAFPLPTDVSNDCLANMPG